jgi:hypothetical protein
VSALIAANISANIFVMLTESIAVDVAMYHSYLNSHRTVTRITNVPAARATRIAAFGNGIRNGNFSRLSYASTFTPIYPCSYEYRL